MIDSHHHLWAYSQREYGWIDDSMAVIARDFNVADLRNAAEGAGVTGTVAVQARQVVEENDALLKAADEDAFVLGVVGWLPPTEQAAAAEVERHAGQAKLRGYRYVAQDEPDNRFLARDEFNAAVARVFAAPGDLVYDILIFERQLPAAIEVVDRHPSGRFVLDHLAKPRAAAGEVEPWRANLSELAERENVACKISGLVTEADWANWSLDSLRPYLDATLEAFGPKRLMFGSDWPVCLLATGYERWLETVTAWAAPLSVTERASLFGGCAIDAYRLDAS
ncbi:MAG: amidohydrolase family protein [Planctomycetota bacterium]